MNKKQFFIVVAILVLIIAGLTLWLFWHRASVSNQEPTGQECQLFQSSDPSAPCYYPSTSGQPEQPIGTSTEPSIPVGVGTTSVAFPDQCAGETSLVTRNQCLSNLAIETKDSGTCDFVSGSVSRAFCINSITETSVNVPQTSQAYQNYIQQIANNQSNQLGATGTVSFSGYIPSTAEETDPKYTAAGFAERYTTASDLKVYALSQYQAKPGDMVSIYGSGFVYPNTVHIGSISISDVKSADGVSLTFSAPSSTGDYDVWVSNSKGSSSPRPRLVVTNDPAPRPQVTGASPSVVSLDGDVTLMGVGFTQNNAVGTTLGLVQNVSSTGNSLHIRIADLPVVVQVKDLKEVKGKKIPVGVAITNENGTSKDMYYFDVQF